jgi:uncharacterized membrane protein
MSLDPLLAAAPIIRVHAFAASIPARRQPVDGAERNAASPHRRPDLGRLDADLGVSAFFIHQIRPWGPWSPIHLLAVFTLVMLPIGGVRREQTVASDADAAIRALWRRAHAGWTHAGRTLERRRS